MEALFKKYFWVIKGLGLAIIMGLAASAISTQMGTRFLLQVDTDGDGEGDDKDKGKDKDKDDDDEDDDGKAKKKKKKSLDFGDNPFSKGGAGGAKKRAKDQVVAKIQERNVFCPTCMPVEDAGEEPQFDAEGRPLGPVIRPGEVKSTLNLRLMATLEAEDPKHSFATVYDGDAEASGLFGDGDVIRPGVMVVGVDHGLLHIRNGAAFEYVELGAEEKKKKKKKKDDKGKKKKKKKKKNKRAIPGAEDAINCPSENQCTIEKEFVEKVLSNPALLAKQARIVPSQKDGEVQGYKFYGIRRGTLPKLLGLKNGDMVTSVNGEELTSVDKAMGLYQKLRHASNLSINITRKGKTINKEINIQ